MDVLLIQPPTGAYRRDDRCQNRVDDQTIQIAFPPMDLAHHAAVLRERGFQCAIRDYSTAKVSLQKALDEIERIKPIVLFFASTQPTRGNDLAFAARVKSLVDGVRIVLRGEAVTFQDETILTHYPQVDYILRGESEETFAELVAWLKKEGDLSISEIAGISYFSGDQVVKTSDRPFISDLNDLPWPARDLLDQSLYRSPETGQRLTTLYAARGCPYPCIFCPAPIASGRPVRLRDVSNLVEEIQDCVDRFGISEFLFHGDTFTYSKDWVLSLCGAIEENNLKVRWGCNSRVDTIDRETLAAMKRAGCWVIGFGVESGHEETLVKIRKAARREQIVEAFQLCREAGIRSHAFMVFGFPWEGPEHLEEDLKLAHEIDPDFFDLNIATPLPGTELEKMVFEEGLVDKHLLEQGGYGVPAARTHHLSREELETWRRKALLSLYLRPRYIFRTLRQAGSPRKAFNYICAGTIRLVQLLKPRRRPFDSEDSGTDTPSPDGPSAATKAESY